METKYHFLSASTSDCNANNFDELLENEKKVSRIYLLVYRQS
jgi:hypothetical protein